MTSNVTPLFSPSFDPYGEARFIANIGDELSLWRIPRHGSTTWMCVYHADGLGLRVTRLRRELEERSGQLGFVAEKIKRHIDTIELYAAMLGERLTDAT
jgi:hypothetical protein